MCMSFFSFLFEEKKTYHIPKALYLQKNYNSYKCFLAENVKYHLKHFCLSLQLYYFLFSRFCLIFMCVFCVQVCSSSNLTFVHIWRQEVNISFLSHLNSTLLFETCSFNEYAAHLCYVSRLAGQWAPWRCIHQFHPEGYKLKMDTYNLTWVMGNWTCVFRL